MLFGAALGGILGSLAFWAMFGIVGLPLLFVAIGGWLGYRSKVPRQYASSGVRRRRLGGPVLLAAVILGVPLLTFGAVKVYVG
jgi:Zn-dependent protease